MKFDVPSWIGLSGVVCMASAPHPHNLSSLAGSPASPSFCRPAGDRQQEAENCAAQLFACRGEVKTLQKRVEAFDSLAGKFQKDISAANERAKQAQASEGQVGATVTGKSSDEET